LFVGTFQLAGQVAAELHLSKSDATDGNDLDRLVNEKTSQGCRDVVIMIAAHGYPARCSNYPHPGGGGNIPESDFAQVQLKYNTRINAGGDDVGGQRRYLVSGPTRHTERSAIPLRVKPLACETG
jgi:hypothetical protein